jgi:ureidoacrylate peracid hydrolase
MAPIDVLRRLEEKIDPKHTALLVVDVQNDFCHSDGALAAGGADLAEIQAMVPRLAKLVRDAHAAGVLIVFLRIVQTPESNSEAWESLEPLDGPRLVVDGGWGAEYYEGLPHECASIEVVKHRHSAFVGTSLDEILRERGCRTVVLGGVATNVCVEGTAREAFDRDYHVVVVDDATGAARRELHEMTLENVRQYLGVVTSCAELAAHWATAPATTDQRSTKETRV